MLRTNIDTLVKLSVQGQITPPLMRGPYRVSREGVPFVLPGTGGISYNVKVGHLAFGWSGDHVEPGVSTAATIDDRGSAKNTAYNTLACVGNEAVVISGDAKGAKGVVTGMHGGIEHVLIDFAQEDLEKMVIEDKILIKSFGQGLELLDYPGITVRNLDPQLLERLGVKEDHGQLVVPVGEESRPNSWVLELAVHRALQGIMTLPPQTKRRLRPLALINCGLVISWPWRTATIVLAAATGGGPSPLA